MASMHKARPSLQVTAIVAAAGQSVRFGDGNKLLRPFGDATVLEVVVRTILRAGFIDVVIVTGHDHKLLRRRHAHLPVSWTYNRNHEAGLGSSLAAGIRSARPDTDAFLICLGDMPLISEQTYGALLDAAEHHPKPDNLIIRPAFKGEMGHPVLIGSSYREDLTALQADEGARSVLQRHRQHLQLLEVTDPGIFYDVDTVADYRRLKKMREGGR